MIWEKISLGKRIIERQKMRNIFFMAGGF